jgi:hypothetical protein
MALMQAVKQLKKEQQRLDNDTVLSPPYSSTFLFKELSFYLDRSNLLLFKRSTQFYEELTYIKSQC